jgi:hypothetical protein
MSEHHCASCNCKIDFKREFCADCEADIAEDIALGDNEGVSND